MRCQGEPINKKGVPAKCSALATQFRKEFVVNKLTKAFVSTKVALCDKCCAEYDEAKQELLWEAKHS